MVSMLLVGPVIIGGALALAAIIALILCCIKYIKHKKNAPKRKSTEKKKDSLELVKRKLEKNEDGEEYADIPDVTTGSTPNYATSQGVSNESYDSVDCERLSDMYEELPEEQEPESHKTPPVHLDTIVIWKEQPYQHLFRESKMLNFRTWLQSRDIAASTVQALEGQGVLKVSDLVLLTEENIKGLRLTMGECNRLRAVLSHVRSIDTTLEWT